MAENWREILDKVARGELTAEQGAVLMGGGKLEAEAAPAPPAPEPAPEPHSQPEPPPSGPSFARASAPAGASPEPDSDPELSSRLEYWKRWWLIPLWIGLGIFIAGAGLIAWGYTSQRTFWFVCGFLPLLFGLLGIVVSWWSQTARWVHVRVHSQKGGTTNRVTVSMPLPIRLVDWGLRIFGDRIPGLNEHKAVRDSLPALFTELEHNREPIAVEVNEKDGTEVRIYIT